jgi:hypothetical protein
MNCARGEAISEGHRRNRSWAREHPGERDEAWFSREIAPKLDAFTLANYGSHGLIARDLLAHTGRCQGAASEALGAVTLVGSTVAGGLAPTSKAALL